MAPERAGFSSRRDVQGFRPREAVGALEEYLGPCHTTLRSAKDVQHLTKHCGLEVMELARLGQLDMGIEANTLR